MSLDVTCGCSLALSVAFDRCSRVEHEAFRAKFFVKASVLHHFEHARIKPYQPKRRSRPISLLQALL